MSGERAERAEADVAIRDEKLRSANRQIVEHAECVGELEYANENRHLHAERSTYAARIAELESALQSSEEERRRLEELVEYFKKKAKPRPCVNCKYVERVVRTGGADA